MTLSSRSSCISLLSSSRITRLLSHWIFYIPSTTSSCESLQRTLIYSVSILSSYPDCNAVTSANLVRCAVHALPTQSFKAGHLRQSYNQAATSDRLNFLQIPQHAPSPLEDALFYLRCMDVLTRKCTADAALMPLSYKTIQSASSGAL